MVGVKMVFLQKELFIVPAEVRDFLRVEIVFSHKKTTVFVPAMAYMRVKNFLPHKNIDVLVPKRLTYFQPW